MLQFPSENLRYNLYRKQFLIVFKSSVGGAVVGVHVGGAKGHRPRVASTLLVCGGRGVLAERERGVVRKRERNV